MAGEINKSGASGSGFTQGINNLQRRNELTQQTRLVQRGAHESFREIPENQLNFDDQFGGREEAPAMPHLAAATLQPEPAAPQPQASGGSRALGLRQNNAQQRLANIMGHLAPETIDWAAEFAHVQANSDAAPAQAAAAPASREALQQAFFDAVSSGDIPTLEHLVRDQGLDINATSRGNDTALHIAAFNGREDVARAVVALGGDPNRANVYAETPAATARDRGQWHVAAYLDSLVSGS